MFQKAHGLDGVPIGGLNIGNVLMKLPGRTSAIQLFGIFCHRLNIEVAAKYVHY